MNEKQNKTNTIKCYIRLNKTNDDNKSLFFEELNHWTIGLAFLKKYKNNLDKFAFK